MASAIRRSTRLKAVAAKHTVQVVSYNVLSSHLSEASHFVHCRPEDCEPDTRYSAVMKKLEPFVEADAIICLQEMSLSWSGRMQPWFESHGYSLVTNCYGSPFNGHMGVAVAVPRTKYEFLDVDLERVSFTKPWPKAPEEDAPPPPAVPSFLESVVAAFKWATGQGEEKKEVSVPFRRPKQDEWDGSKSRHNRMISVKVKPVDTEDDAGFCISTYHMPCAFYNQKLMVVHTALAAQHALRVADGLPMVLCGDWNFKPGDASYRFMTTGELDTKDEAYPDYRAFDPWRIEQGMVGLPSAYAVVNGKEPPFTNYAFTARDEQAFVDTLDYFFMSPGVAAVEVGDLPESTDAIPGTSLPSAEEPSDHLLVSAVFEINGDNDSSKL